MSHTIRSFEPTPNPRALKCLLDAPPKAVGVGVRSYTSAASARAAGDALAVLLLEVEGVERVMVLGDFATVTRAEGAKWSKLKPALERALKEGA